MTILTPSAAGLTSGIVEQSRAHQAADLSDDSRPWPYRLEHRGAPNPGLVAAMEKA
jgi:hypothetical protein